MTTIKQLAEFVQNTAKYPKGMDTDVVEVFKGEDLRWPIRKVKNVYELTIKTPYNGEDPKTIICRTEAKAKAAMDADISERLASGETYAMPETLVREGDRKAHLSNKVEWVIEEKTLVR